MNEPNAQKRQNCKHPDNSPACRWWTSGGNPKPRFSSIGCLLERFKETAFHHAFGKSMDGISKVAKRW